MLRARRRQSRALRPTLSPVSCLLKTRPQGQHPIPASGSTVQWDRIIGAQQGVAEQVHPDSHAVAAQQVALQILVIILRPADRDRLALAPRYAGIEEEQPIDWWQRDRDHSEIEPSDQRDRKSTRLNSSHSQISYAVFCLKKKKKKT